MFILYHNFWTKNAGKLIKVSKDTDSSLVCNKNFSEIHPSSGWAQVRYQQAKMAKNLPYLWHHSQKNETENQTFFFIAGVKTCQVFWGYEQLSGAIRWGAMRLLRQPKYACFFPDFHRRYIRRPATNVLSLVFNIFSLFKSKFEARQ